MRYAVVLSKDTNGTFLVRFPDVPEAVTFGDTKEEALTHAVDALATALEGLMKDRRDVASPSARGAHYVELPTMMAAKVRLYQAMREQKVGKAELGRLLNVHLPQVDRLLTMRHASRLDQLASAFGVLGKRIDLVVTDDTPAAPRRRPRRPGTARRVSGTRHALAR